jgi:pimeloyl-ACP methyl ester carboxylesterase
VDLAILKSPLMDLLEARRACPGKLVRTSLGEVHVRVSGHGPPIVMAHGITESCETFLELQEQLSHLATIHAIDLPGHGFTDIPSGALSLDEMARWVESYMDAAKIERAVVVGWSLGGGVSLSLALRAPKRVAALVLIGSIGTEMPVPRMLGLMRYRPFTELVVRASKSPGFRRAMARGIFHPSFTPSEHLVDRNWPSWRIRGRVQYLRALMNSIDMKPLEARLPEVSVPTYVIHGTADAIVPFRVGRTIAAKVPNAKLFALPRTGHAPHHEEPAVVRMAIREALTYLANG